MKRIIRITNLLALVFLLTTPLFAKEFLKPENIKTAASSIDIKKYPNADDVVIDDFTQVTYQPTGRSETWSDVAIKVLTERGKRSNSSISLHFDVAYGKANFVLVEVIKPDGTIQQINIAKQSKEMVDPSQMGSNIYDPNSKLLLLSVPGLEVGDVLRYVAHRVATTVVVPGTWSDYQVFEGPSPICHSTYQVIAPSTLPLKKIVLKAAVKNTVHFKKMGDEKGKKIVYTWEVSNVPRMFTEPNMPATYTVVQRLLVSTINDWEYLSKWYWHLSKPHLDLTTPAMKTMAKKLVKNAKTQREKIEAIFKFVSQDIRYMGITTETAAPGYEPHDVKITFENRYGVCRDKAALLVAMLRMVDIKAFPVLIMAGPKKDEEVPQPYFNHAITAALGEDGKYILMDPTNENTKDIFPAYLQNMSYLVARAKGETLLTTSIISARKNLLKINTKAQLDAGGTLTAKTQLSFEGINDTVYRGYFSRLKPEELERFFLGHLKKTMPSVELKSIEVTPKTLRDTSKPLSVHLLYSAPNMFVEGEKNKILTLPRLGGGIGYVNFLIGQTGLDKRKYPLATSNTAGIEETLELTLPEQTGTLKIPTYSSIKTDLLTWENPVVRKGNTLFSTNTFLINTVEFTPKEYLVLKQQLKKIEYNQRKKIIFEKAGLAQPSDIRILEKNTTVDLDDSSHWKKTQHLRFKVLTYNGKKAYSEIKVSYNPAWQSVRLVHATVTQPDGSVKKIQKQEINLMDAAWVASAPRYPSEKILVANIPGVEVGSIVDYEILIVTKGKPFFSTVQTFKGFNIIDSLTYTIHAPEQLNLSIHDTNITHSTTHQKGIIAYTWTVKNQKPLKKEEMLPLSWAYNPATFVSAGDWKTYATLVKDRLKIATKNQIETKKLAKQLTLGMHEDLQKVISLRNWVAKNITTAGPSFVHLPLSVISPADQTLTDRYGNNTDRMIVLYTLLENAKFNPTFVLSGGMSLIPQEIKPLISTPIRDLFNTLLIQLKLDGETIYLDGSSQYAELGTSRYADYPLLNLKTGTISTVEVSPRKANKSHILLDINIAKNGDVGITQTSIKRGTAFERFHQQYAEMPPETRRRLYLEMVATISQSAKPVSKLITDYSSYPGKLDFSVFVKKYAVQDGNYLYFSVPDSLGGLLKYRSNKRVNPLAWKREINSTYECNIVLPNGYKPLIMPQNFNWQAPNNAGQISVQVKYFPRVNAIRIVQMVDLQPALIPAKKFAEILKASRTLAHPSMRTILLKKTSQKKQNETSLKSHPKK